VDLVILLWLSGRIRILPIYLFLSYFAGVVPHHVKVKLVVIRAPMDPVSVVSIVHVLLYGQIRILHDKQHPIC